MMAARILVEARSIAAPRLLSAPASTFFLSTQRLVAKPNEEAVEGLKEHLRLDNLANQQVL